MIKKRIRNHTNPLNFRDRLLNIDINGYDPSMPLDLEIGFGRGKFAVGYAERNPDRFLIAVEVRKQMVQLFNEKHNVANLHAVWGTGQICLEDMIKDHSLERVFIFHPDPWFKKRHHKRRVLNQDLLENLKKKLIDNGTIYISTDVVELYDDMLSVCRDYGMSFIEDDPFWAPIIARTGACFLRLINAISTL